jgi:hypothetical protein
MIIRNTGLNHFWSAAMRHFLIFLSLLLAWPAQAHEYWIEPKAYVLTPDTTVMAGLFNGQNFKGGEFTFFPKTFRRFDLALGEQVVPVQGRMGDRPALVMPPLGEGLHVAIFESAGDIVNYSDFAVFTKFVKHKDLPGVLARHAARGLPEKDFFEFYSRYSKALIAVGNGTGADKAYGLETEIVALKNPYTDDVSQGLPVKVIYRGAVRANAQVEFFDKDAAGVVNITLHRTGSDGVALLPVARRHSYLVDAVVMREPEVGSVAAEKGAVWESLWAALTFAVPQ